MKRILVLSTLIMLLEACTPAKIASGLIGGGPNVAANVQVGKTNTQTIGQTRNTEQKLVLPSALPEQVIQSSDEVGVRAEAVERIVVNEAPLWLIIVAFIGWILPTPRQIAEWLISPFKRNKVA